MKLFTCSDLPEFNDEIKCGDIDVSGIWDNIYDQMREKQDYVLKSVLREFLGREPTIKDVKKCTLYQYPDRLKYGLAYKSTMLGDIELFMGPEFKVTFTPYAGNI